MLNYSVKAEWQTIENTTRLGRHRKPPLFGIEPDARVWALAGEAADPQPCGCSICAGTGRNALALARRGHPVDAVEMTPKFAEIIRAEAQREALDVRVIQRDVFAPINDLRRDYRLIVLSEVVSDFRTTQQLRGVFDLADGCLAPGGRLVFNAFFACPGYIPDDAARELGQQVYTTIFTRQELANAAAHLPFELVAMTRSTSMRKPICPKAAGHPPAGMPLG